jgi:hypothetical protein
MEGRQLHAETVAVKRRSSDCSGFERFRSTGFLTDTTILCGGKFFDIHGVVLAAASPHFENILSTMSLRPKRVAQERLVVCMDDLDPTVMEAILDLIYTGQVLLPSEKLKDFLELAERFRIRGFDCAPSFPSTSSTFPGGERGQGETPAASVAPQRQRKMAEDGASSSGKRRRENPVNVREQPFPDDLESEMRLQLAAFDAVCTLLVALLEY